MGAMVNVDSRFSLLNNSHQARTINLPPIAYDGEFEIHHHAPGLDGLNRSGNFAASTNHWNETREAILVSINRTACYEISFSHTTIYTTLH